ncbi:MAG: hypothetical protein C0508_00570 [Cyanobacteria bacterium PR.023]|nr:hypothetical protein [Cyanobacteria bacterium PR.023]
MRCKCEALSKASRAAKTANERNKPINMKDAPEPNCSCANESAKAPFNFIWLASPKPFKDAIRGAANINPIKTR